MKKLALIANLDLAVACISFAILVVITFLGVIFRYFLGSPIIWIEEVQLWCFLWMTFLAAGAGFRKGTHVSIEIIFEMLPLNIQKILGFVNWLIVITILGYVAYVGIDLLQLMIKINKQTSILRMPLWFINAMVPIGFVLMVVSATVAQIRPSKPNTNANQNKELN